MQVRVHEFAAADDAIQITPAGQIPERDIDNTGRVMREPGEIAAVLSGTPLADLPIGHGPSGTILILDISPGGLLQAWQAAHALVPVTNRWPVLVTDWADRRLSLQPHPDPMAPDESELLALDQAARTIDPWSHFRRWGDRDLVSAEDLRYVAVGAGVDLTDEVLRQVELPATRPVVEHWLYDRVSADPELNARVLSHARSVVKTDRWFTPANISLALLPTAASWLAPLWISFFGALGHERELAAALWQWHQRWNATLVASWDTMLQLLIGRPPAPGEHAWTVAGQMKALASHLDMPQWQLAVAVPHGDAWFIHNRP